MNKYSQAKELGIRLTNAEVGTDICQAWEDRVDLAIKYWNDGDMENCQAAIDEANKYAI